MKVIGTGVDGKYICEVSHTEIEKFQNLYFGKVERLSIGDEVDFGAGYDFSSDIQSAFQKTKAFLEANGEIVNAIMNGLTVTGPKERSDD
ncbi:hypothetical protein KAR91_22140 [Candidatus Pacearchaeota archaeon]|nr:hypothetical protein [Candidatus Pacearchaeota archaeon]